MKSSRFVSHNQKLLTAVSLGVIHGWEVRPAIEPHVLDKLYQVLLNYDIYAARLDALKKKMAGLVKPESVTKFAYI